MEKKDITEDKTRLMIEDLKKYAKKINAMMIDSVEGEAPQSLKLLLFVKMGDFVREQLKSLNKKSYEEGVKLIDEYIENFGNLKCFVPKDKEEAQKFVERFEDKF